MRMIVRGVSTFAVVALAAAMCIGASHDHCSPLVHVRSAGLTLYGCAGWIIFVSEHSGIPAQRLRSEQQWAAADTGHALEGAAGLSEGQYREALCAVDRTTEEQCLNQIGAFLPYRSRHVEWSTGGLVTYCAASRVVLSTCLLTAALAMWITPCVRAVRRWRHRLGNLCAVCGYPLCGLNASRCPECGEPFTRGMPGATPATAATPNARPRGSPGDDR